MRQGLNGAETVFGVLAALYERQRTGKGQRVDVSMLDASLFFSMILRKGFYFATGKALEALGNAHFQIVPANNYLTSDRRHIMIMAHNEKWNALMYAIGDTALANDRRLATNGGRVRERATVDDHLARAFAADTLDNWIRRLDDAGALCVRVRKLDEVFADPEVQADMVVELEHPTAGTISVMGSPIRFSESPTSIRLRPPLLGEHTQEVLKQLGIEADGHSLR